MCVVSMVMDHYKEKWEPLTWPTSTKPTISDEEIQEFKRLLERAREYDKRNNEPNCELDEKRQVILDIAKQLGVEVKFV